MPFMPAPQEHPLPLARARARLEFDALVRDRLQALRDAPQLGDEHGERRQHLDGFARAFADAVDRANAGRQVTREAIIEYVDAVLLVGDAGELVVPAPEYDDAPVYWHARARTDDAIRGRDLDGYLRTGEARYAEHLGLAP